MPKLSMMQRALADAREEYLLVEVVEHWNPHSRRRKDLFGFADLIAVGDESVTLVQVTSGANHAARRKKILENENAKRWLADVENRFIEVWSYSKLKAGWKRRTENISLFQPNEKEYDDENAN